MPTYSFVDDKGNLFDKFLKMSEVDDFLKNNPGFTKVITSTGIIGGLSMDSGRLPDGFKDRLREMAKKHPNANGIKHLI